MLSESHTGYLSDFIVYTDAGTVYPEPSITLPKPFEDYSNPSKIVLSLLEGFHNAGYNFALENLHTSPELLRVLFENKTDPYGTLHKKKGLTGRFLVMEANKRSWRASKSKII